MKLFFSILLGYLLGSFPTAFLISKIFYKKDIRKIGDGNPGAQNVWRSLSKFAGTIVALIDFFKGFFSFLIPYIIFNDYTFSYISSFSAIIGHDFPLWTKFYGGKAMASIYGILFAMFPFPVLLGLSIGFASIPLLKTFERGMALGMITLLISAFLMHAPISHFLFSLLIIPTIGIKKWVDIKTGREILRKSS